VPMSSTLFFRRTPTATSKSVCSFGQPIKGAIARRFYDHDGSLGGELLTIGRDELGFFEGLAAACPNPKDRTALEVIVSILRDHGTIDMWFEV